MDYMDIADTITRLLEKQEKVKIHYKLKEKGEDYDERKLRTL